MRRAAGRPRILIGIDGPGASGKSTLAGLLATVLEGSAVVHVDDFYLPSADRNSRAGQVGAQFDLPRLATQVVEPAAAGRGFRYQRYGLLDDCDSFVDLAHRSQRCTSAAVRGWPTAQAPPCVIHMMDDELQREVGRLEARLAGGGATPTPVIEELSRMRHDLASGGARPPAFQLANLRIGQPCKERWADMVGDDRVRACAGCERPVFNLSEMTRAQAEAVLATRGVTPCVRFYRRADGTVMTADCPTGTRREGRRLAVVASTLAAGTALAGASPAMAEPPAPAMAEPATPAPAPASDDASEPATPDPLLDDPLRAKSAQSIDDAYMGIMITTRVPDRPTLQWSTWARVGGGIASHPTSLVARGITLPMAEQQSTWEAAIAADLSLSVAHRGDVRLGAWTELRTSSGPVVGGELVVEGLPPHPYTSDFNGSGSVVLRAGGNSHVLTTAIAFGYVGSWYRSDRWIRSVSHVVGARVVASVNRSLDGPRDWSATVGIELEPIGVLGYLLGLGSRR